MEMGRQTNKLPFGDSPFPYSVCDHMGINIYSDSTRDTKKLNSGVRVR